MVFGSDEPSASAAALLVHLEVHVLHVLVAAHGHRGVFGVRSEALGDGIGAIKLYGDRDEALAAAQKNAELAKFVPFTAFGTVLVLLRMREYDGAIARTRAGLEFFSEFWQGHWLLAGP